MDAVLNSKEQKMNCGYCHFLGSSVILSILCISESDGTSVVYLKSHWLQLATSNMKHTLPQVLEYI